MTASAAPDDKTYDWSFTQSSTWEWTGHVQGVGAVHAWIQGRRSYCDRGHWEWGYDVDGFLPAIGPQPSYYFMSFARARHEIERWLMSGQNTAEKTNLLPGDTQSFSIPNSTGSWTPVGPDIWEAHWPEEPQGLATLVFQDDPLDPTWLLDIKAPDLDASDRFPRLYRDGATARQEAEEFICWRWLKIRSEDPEAMIARCHAALEDEGFSSPALRHPVSSILRAHIDADVLPSAHHFSAASRSW